jgi:hypothetical protein
VPQFVRQWPVGPERLVAFWFLPSCALGETEGASWASPYPGLLFWFLFLGSLMRPIALENLRPPVSLFLSEAGSAKRIFPSLAEGATTGFMGFLFWSFSLSPAPTP